MGPGGLLCEREGKRALALEEGQWGGALKTISSGRVGVVSGELDRVWWGAASFWRIAYPR